MVAPARAGRWLALVVCQLLSVRPFMAPAVSPLAPRRVARSVMEKKADVVHAKEEKERELVEKALMDEWMTAWEDEKAQEGFDWEMEKLRRKLDDATPRRRRRAPALHAPPHAQFLLGNESEDGAAVAGWDWRGALERAGPGLMAKSIATGDLQTLVGGPLFLLLTKYHNELGPVFKLAFGPRSFIVVADPSIMRYILRDGAMNYDKGILAEILAPILGNGLIPADPDVWRRRRRVITPAFHKQWLASTLSLFDECTMELVDDLKARHATAEPAPLPATVDAWTAWKADDAQPRSLGAVDMEERFCSAESPLVRAVYRCLIEAEKRTTAFIPFWLIPGAQFLPSQVAFKNDLDLLNAKLDELVAQAFEEQIDDDDMLEAGQEVTKASTERISLLRFLVTIRGEEASTGQLRDDLMTMLVAGHETTAALLTWTLYELFHPSKRAAGHLERLRREVDANFALRKSENRTATAYADVVDCAFARLCLAEGLRLYPQPPLLIRRALDSDELPQPYADEDRVKIARGTDALYPTEQSADYAFLPFGAGNRRCVGDQFAILEATVMLTTLIREFDFEFALDDPSTLAPKTGLGGLPVADVGMRTGATIHTEHGLWMTAKPREHPS
ncbi:cytochrome p450 [Aureococcus anophagefferens]|nr:cytochrome p450 [Aureococcus anophagefferens]